MSIAGRISHDHGHQPGSSVGAFLYPALDAAAQGQPPHYQSYRDTFRQFLIFAQQRLNLPPSRLSIEQIDAPLVVAFLDELEKHRGLTVRSCNLRLTAIHSFFHYVAFELPTHAAQIQRVLAIPSKRFTRTLVSFLTRLEVDAYLPHQISTPGLGGATMRSS